VLFVVVVVVTPLALTAVLCVVDEVAVPHVTLVLVLWECEPLLDDVLVLVVPAGTHAFAAGTWTGTGGFAGPGDAETG